MVKQAIFSIVAGTGLLVPSLSSAAALFPAEQFNYADATVLVGTSNWIQQTGGGTNTTNPFTVVGGSLTYAGGGIPASAGGKMPMADNGQDAVAQFTGGTVTPADGNTYYFSCILQHDGTDMGNSTGDHIIHFTGGTDGGSTAFRGRLFVGDSGTAGQMKVGARFSSASTVAYASTTVAANTPAFVVMKMTEVAGTDNDTAQLFLFTTGAVPAAEPGSADATSTGNGGTDNDIALFPTSFPTRPGIGSLNLRQGATSSSAAVSVDELRCGTTWADVVPPVGSGVADWQLME